MALPKSFNDLITQSEQPVLVDFWAEWCGPCHTLAPSIAQIAREYKGRLVVIKVNVDEKPVIASQFQVQSIPTLMVFHHGQTLGRKSGALPYGALKQFVDSTIAKKV